MGLDLAQLNTDLGAYTRKYSKDIFAQVFQGIELENYMTGVSGVTDEYVNSTATIGEVLQPFHTNFQKKGGVTLTPRVNKVRQMKVDFELTDLDDLYRTYLAFLADETTERAKWPIVKYITQYLLIPRMIEDLNTASATGVYAANAGVEGTPSDAIDSVDGLLTIIAAEITASNLTPIVTGAITSANILDKVNTFIDAIPSKYDGKKMDIMMSATLARLYGRAYKAEFGQSSNYRGNGESVANVHYIDGSNIRVVGINSFGSSQRFLATPKINLVKLFDKVNIPGTFDVQPNRRAIEMMTDFKRGYGFRTLDIVFVNDQA